MMLPPGFNWRTASAAVSGTGTTQYEGLFGKCDNSNPPICTWFWQNDFGWEKAKADWHKASQGLFAAGLLLLDITWWICTFHVCCCCCKESTSVGSALGSLMASGTVLVAASLTLYGAYWTKEEDAGFKSDKPNFYWAYFVGMAGVAAALAAVILFFCDGCRNRSHAGYHMTRVV